MRFSLYIIIISSFSLLILSSECKSQNNTITLRTDSLKLDSIPKINYAQMIDSIIFYAEKYLGTRYKSGGIAKQGFDCSGFTSYVFGNYGIKLPHSSRDQALKGMPLDISEIKRGDLVFFKGRNQKGSAVGHVGLVVERNDSIIRFIHSSHKKGIDYDFVSSDYYKKRFIGAKRILGDNVRDSLWAGFKLPELAEEDSLDSDVETSKTDNNKQLENQQVTDKTPSKNYVVMKGDTLYAIAKKNHTTADRIKALNKLKNNKIHPGQKLVVK